MFPRARWSTDNSLGASRPRLQSLFSFKCWHFMRKMSKSIVSVCDRSDLVIFYDLNMCGLTSAGAKAQRSPRLAARAGPSDDGRSRITADAPFCTRRSTVARPKPDAPPVTRPTIPWWTHTDRDGPGGEEGSTGERQESKNMGQWDDFWGNSLEDMTFRTLMDHCINQRINQENKSQIKQ